MIRAHILPMFLRNIAIKGELQRIAKVVETVGNKGKAAISGGFQSVEMRGIAPVVGILTILRCVVTTGTLLGTFPALL